MSGVRTPVSASEPQGSDRGTTRSAPTTSTLADRNARERDEWRAAGEVASGLDRARVALALAGARSSHAVAEGFAYE